MLNKIRLFMRFASLTSQLDSISHNSSYRGAKVLAHWLPLKQASGNK